MKSTYSDQGANVMWHDTFSLGTSMSVFLLILLVNGLYL